MFHPNQLAPIKSLRTVTVLTALTLACTSDDDDKDDDSGDTDTGVEIVEPQCNDMAEPPVEVETLGGFSGSEDFAFDREGYLVSVDQQGNLVGRNQAGQTRVISPNFGAFAAGTRFLPNGDLVVSDGAQSLYRITPEGASSVILSGLAYPNGIEVDPEGFVYVAEQDIGRIRRIEPETGEFTILAEGLVAPNGLAFGPEWTTLYFNSFGGGTVHAINRSGDTWSAPELVGTTVDRTLSCTDLAAGDACYLVNGGIGSCAQDDDSLVCESNLDYASCQGLAEADPCATVRWDSPTDSVCSLDDAGDLFCPRVDSDRIASCEGLQEYDSCSYKGDTGICYGTWEGVDICYTDEDWLQSETACEGLDEGTPCVVDDPAYPLSGECTLFDGFSYCLGEGAGSGALDGMNVDECGYIYVSEYITGKIWRWNPDRTNLTEIARLDSFWIPNLHWGNGVGGWEEDVVYVMDRDEGRVFALQVGVKGREYAYWPEESESP